MDPNEALSYVLRAKWVFPVAGEPIEHGCITVRAGVIQAVGRKTDDGPLFDLGNVAVLPGLINCHTHLEFSDLSCPIGEPGTPFPEWIGQVVAHRRRQSAIQSGTQHDLAQRRKSTWLRGWHECIECGTVAVGEIATLPWEWPTLQAAEGNMHATVFFELLGLSSGRTAENLRLATRHLEGIPRGEHANAGLSPHAPYTVHPELLRGAVELAAKRRATVAMHLAESPEEIDLLAGGGGPFPRLLESLGAWQSELFLEPRRPLDYLEALRPAPRTLVIHGNYLDTEEMQWIANQEGRFTVIYCPRTHAYFGHRRYPLVQLRRRGVSVALGTDSRASNPDLSLWEELRFVARHFPEFDGAEILRMGTIAGAQALGKESSLGMITPKRHADLTIVPLGDRCPPNPYQALWEGGAARRLPRNFPTAGEKGTFC